MGWDAEGPEWGEGGHLTREERRYWRNNEKMLWWWMGCICALIIIMPGQKKTLQLKSKYIELTRTDRCGNQAVRESLLELRPQMIFQISWETITDKIDVKLF